MIFPSLSLSPLLRIIITPRSHNTSKYTVLHHNHSKNHSSVQQPSAIEQAIDILSLLSPSFSVFSCPHECNVAVIICHLNSAPPCYWFTSHSAFNNFMHFIQNTLKRSLVIRQRTNGALFSRLYSIHPGMKQIVSVLLTPEPISGTSLGASMGYSRFKQVYVI